VPLDAHERQAIETTALCWKKALIPAAFVDAFDLERLSCLYAPPGQAHDDVILPHVRRLLPTKCYDWGYRRSCAIGSEVHLLFWRANALARRFELNPVIAASACHGVSLLQLNLLSRARACLIGVSSLRMGTQTEAYAGKVSC
jgi:hypothetical protein